MAITTISGLTYDSDTGIWTVPENATNAQSTAATSMNTLSGEVTSGFSELTGAPPEDPVGNVVLNQAAGNLATRLQNDSFGMDDTLVKNQSDLAVKRAEEKLQPLYRSATNEAIARGNYRGGALTSAYGTINQNFADNVTDIETQIALGAAQIGVQDRATAYTQAGNLATTGQNIANQKFNAKLNALTGSGAHVRDSARIALETKRYEHDRQKDMFEGLFDFLDSDLYDSLVNSLKEQFPWLAVDWRSDGDGGQPPPDGGGGQQPPPGSGGTTGTPQRPLGIPDDWVWDGEHWGPPASTGPQRPDNVPEDWTWDGSKWVPPEGHTQPPRPPGTPEDYIYNPVTEVWDAPVTSGFSHEDFNINLIDDTWRVNEEGQVVITRGGDDVVIGELYGPGLIRFKDMSVMDYSGTRPEITEFGPIEGHEGPDFLSGDIFRNNLGPEDWSEASNALWAELEMVHGTNVEALLENFKNFTYAELEAMLDDPLSMITANDVADLMRDGVVRMTDEEWVSFLADHAADLTITPLTGTWMFDGTKKENWDFGNLEELEMPKMPPGTKLTDAEMLRLEKFNASMKKTFKYMSADFVIRFMASDQSFNKLIQSAGEAWDDWNPTMVKTAVIGAGGDPMAALAIETVLRGIKDGNFMGLGNDQGKAALIRIGEGNYEKDAEGNFTERGRRSRNNDVDEVYRFMASAKGNNPLGQDLDTWELGGNRHRLAFKNMIGAAGPQEGWKSIQYLKLGSHMEKYGASLTGEMMESIIEVTGDDAFSGDSLYVVWMTFEALHRADGDFDKAIDEMDWLDNDQKSRVRGGGTAITGPPGNQPPPPPGGGDISGWAARDADGNEIDVADLHYLDGVFYDSNNNPVEWLGTDEQRLLVDGYQPPGDGGTETPPLVGSDLWAEGDTSGNYKQVDGLWVLADDGTYTWDGAKFVQTEIQGPGSQPPGDGGGSQPPPPGDGGATSFPVGSKEWALAGNTEGTYKQVDDLWTRVETGGTHTWDSDTNSWAQIITGAGNQPPPGDGGGDPAVIGSEAWALAGNTDGKFKQVDDLWVLAEDGTYTWDGRQFVEISGAPDNGDDFGTTVDGPPVVGSKEWALGDTSGFYRLNIDGTYARDEDNGTHTWDGSQFVVREPQGPSPADALQLLTQSKGQWTSQNVGAVVDGIANGEISESDILALEDSIGSDRVGHILVRSQEALPGALERFTSGTFSQSSVGGVLRYVRDPAGTHTWSQTQSAFVPTQNTSSQPPGNQPPPGPDDPAVIGSEAWALAGNTEGRFELLTGTDAQGGRFGYQDSPTGSLMWDSTKGAYGEFVPYVETVTGPPGDGGGDPTVIGSDQWAEGDTSGKFKQVDGSWVLAEDGTHTWDGSQGIFVEIPLTGAPGDGGGSQPPPPGDGDEAPVYTAEDFEKFYASWNKSEGDAGYNPAWDINNDKDEGIGDGKVDFNDLLAIALGLSKEEADKVKAAHPELFGGAGADETNPDLNQFGTVAAKISASATPEQLAAYYSRRDPQGGEVAARGVEEGTGPRVRPNNLPENYVYNPETGMWEEPSITGAGGPADRSPNGTANAGPPDTPDPNNKVAPDWWWEPSAGPFSVQTAHVTENPDGSTTDNVDRTKDELGGAIAGLRELGHDDNVIWQYFGKNGYSYEAVRQAFLGGHVAATTTSGDTYRGRVSDGVVTSVTGPSVSPEYDSIDTYVEEYFASEPVQ